MRKGRILLLTSNFPRWPGDSTTPFILHLARDLTDLGWQVDVLAPHAPGAAKSEILEGVNIIRFQYFWPARTQTVCYEGGALNKLAKSRSHYFKLPALITAEGVAALKLLASGRYDLVHSHWILPQGFIGELVTRIIKVPHVVTVHGGDIFALQGKLLEKFKAFTLNNADAVTVNSSYTRKAVLNLAPGLNNLHTIPMGASKQEPDSHSKESIRRKFRCGEGPLLIFVGRLVHEKGIQDYIDTVAILSKELPEISALVIGEGPDRHTFEAHAEFLGITKKIHFLGWVESNRVPDFMAAADIFVGPSRTAENGWVEAQGITFIEAMLAGTPVIGSNIGGISDAVINEKTGLLVDEQSPNQLAAAIRKLQLDGDLLSRITYRAKLNAEKQFTRPITAKMFSKLFYQLIRKK